MPLAAPGLLRRLAKNLWVADGKFTYRPIPAWMGQLGVRMTVVRLADGGLVLHSPIHLDRELRDALDEAGPVRFVVAPNLNHFEFVPACAEAYPDAVVLVAPGLGRRRLQLAAYEELDETRPVARGELEQTLFRGHMLAETVFFHRPSRTLITSDLAYNVGPDEDLIFRLFYRRHDGYGRFALPSYHRQRVTDPEALRASLGRVLEWDFDRVVVAHGRVLETGGREAFRRIWEWAL